MNKIGFIGFGAMGSIMLKALLDAGAIPEKNVVLNTRTPSKLGDFSKKYPGVKIVDNLPKLASQCVRVFICTGTREVKPVLEELVKYLPQNAHVITITGAIELKCIETIFNGSISKLMPTQIAAIGEGVTLVTHNAKATPADRSFIAKAFGKIGRVKEITEEQIDLAADLTGCSPAFFAAIVRSLAKAAGHHGNFTSDELNDLILPTYYGTAKLLMESGITPDDLIARVATKGGITEEGVKILDKALPNVFDEMLRVTLGKRLKIKQQIREQYGLK